MSQFFKCATNGCTFEATIAPPVCGVCGESGPFDADVETVYFPPLPVPPEQATEIAVQIDALHARIAALESERTDFFDELDALHARIERSLAAPAPDSVPEVANGEAAQE